MNANPRFMGCAAGLIHALPVPVFAGVQSALKGLLPAKYRDLALGDKFHKMADLIQQKNAPNLYMGMIRHWRQEVVLGAGQTSTVFDEAWPSLGTLTEQLMLLDCRSYLPDDIMTKVDRASMSVGLEARAVA